MAAIEPLSAAISLLSASLCSYQSHLQRLCVVMGSSSKKSGSRRSKNKSSSRSKHKSSGSRSKENSSRSKHKSKSPESSRRSRKHKSSSSKTKVHPLPINDEFDSLAPKIGLAGEVSKRLHRGESLKSPKGIAFQGSLRNLSAATSDSEPRNDSSLTRSQGHVLTRHTSRAGRLSKYTSNRNAKCQNPFTNRRAQTEGERLWSICRFRWRLFYTWVLIIRSQAMYGYLFSKKRRAIALECAVSKEESKFKSAAEKQSLVRDDDWRKKWEYVMVLSCAWSILVLPMQLGKSHRACEIGNASSYFKTDMRLLLAAFSYADHVFNRWNFSDIILDLLFLVDIIVWFRTPFTSVTGKKQHGSQQMMKHYLSGWFVPDFLMWVPFYLMVELSGNKVSGNVNLLRMLK